MEFLESLGSGFSYSQPFGFYSGTCSPVFEKLQADYQRFLEIERSLLDPEVTADVSRVTALAKERGTLAKVAVPYGRYLELGRQIAEAESLFATETDPEMRSYAEGELEGLRKQQRRKARRFATCSTTARRVPTTRR